MFRWLKDTPIRHKLIILIMAVACAVLLLVAAAFVAWEVYSFREQRVSDLSSLADITAFGSQAALSFADEKAAQETLEALRFKSFVVCAATFDKEGRALAFFHRAEVPASHQHILKWDEGHYFVDNYLVAVKKVFHDRSHVGTVLITSNLSDLYERIRIEALMALGILVVAMVLAFFLASSLQRYVTEPISDLMDSTKRVGKDKDYSIRVSADRNDEIGVLISGFNEMLGEIEQREASLEKEIAFRTVDLRSALDAAEVAKEDLRREKDFAEGMIETAQVIVLLLDNEGRIMRFNRYMEEISGYRLEEMQDKLWFEEFIPERDVEQIRAVFKGVKELEQVRGQTNAIVIKDGSEREIEWYNKALKDSYGNVIGVLAIGQDISDRQMMELQLRHAQKIEAIGTLAAGIAHEINTPAQYVNHNISFLEESYADLMTLVERFFELVQALQVGLETRDIVKNIDELVEEIDLDFIRREIPLAIVQSLDGIRNISDIVRAMKDFSYPGGKNKVAVDINKAVLDTVIVSKNEWKYVAKLETDLDPNLPPVPCFVGEINQVVLNLIVNAAHAIEEVESQDRDWNGLITVATRRDESSVIIRVSDNGTGIPKSLREHIFDPFFTSKEFGRGTGQGLTIAHTVVVEKHKGNILFETEEGKGTTFAVKLPLGDNLPT